MEWKNGRISLYWCNHWCLKTKEINHLNYTGLLWTCTVFLLQEQSRSIQSPRLCERSTGMTKPSRQTITAANCIRSDFYRGSLPRLTCGKVCLWYLNGLIWNKGMEKGAKSLQELNCCVSRTPPRPVEQISWREAAAAATPSDWWPCNHFDWCLTICLLNPKLHKRRENCRRPDLDPLYNNKKGFKCFHDQPGWLPNL